MPDAHADLLSPNNPLSQTDYTERRVSTSLWRRLIEAQNALPDGCLMRTFKVGDEVAEDATILVDQVMKERSARCQKSSSAAERVSLDSGSVSLYDPPVAQSEKKKRPPPPLPPRPRPTLDQVGMESESSETIKPPPIPPRTAKAS